MRARSHLSVALMIAGVGLFTIGCSDTSPTKPSKPSSSTPVSIQIVGPASVSPGQSGQLVAKIGLSDGTTKSATSLPNLRWISSDPSALIVTSSGVVFAPDITTGGAGPLGDVVITATFTDLPGVLGSHVIAVQPAPIPTYSLSVSAEVVAAGSPLSVSWVAPSGGTYDWIAMYKAGSSSLAYEDIWWEYTNGAATGTFTIRAPTEPGQYEFRYFVDDGFDMVAKSNLIRVTVN